MKTKLFLIRHFGLKALLFDIVGMDETAIFFEYKENAYVYYKNLNKHFCIIKNTCKTL